MSDDDFYEDDEPIEDIIAAWNASTERGFTTGSKSVTVVLPEWPVQADS